MASPVSAPSINDGAKGKGKAKRRRKLQPEIAQLVQDLYAEAKDTLTSTADVTITANGIETPLGILSLEQVEEGENVLKEIAKELKKKRKSSKKLEELSGDFYTTIPTKIGRTKDQIKDAVIDTVAAVAEKQDLCQLMRDMLQVMATDAGALVGDGGVEAQYAALGCTLQPVPPESEEHRAVMERIEESVQRSHGQLDLLRGGGGGPVRAVYRARRAEEEARFTARVTKNQQLLFHGSRACNFVGLLSRGILLPKIVVSLGVTRTDGGWLGDGIYFGDFDTSLNYTSSSSKGIKYMLVNLVALGRMKDFSNITYGLQKPPKGYDSCHGNPEAEEGSEFEDHEYVVYQEDQQKVQYLLELNDEI
uniref:Poly [ADP-ribose] polymerase n=2 Tax=Heterosigma akashiwo TaxID=2829 RepID=A0A6V1QIY2_HETAK|mmetsp:Transcript_11146/g.17879  ORF Transcript_11146/g.17879 Transcript_11146/m.17879 type:complete len:363 (-) Transcript_11146:372-1460(-)